MFLFFVPDNGNLTAVKVALQAISVRLKIRVENFERHLVTHNGQQLRIFLGSVPKTAFEIIRQRLQRMRREKRMFGAFLFQLKITLLEVELLRIAFRFQLRFQTECRQSCFRLCIKIFRPDAYMKAMVPAVRLTMQTEGSLRKHRQGRDARDFEQLRQGMVEEDLCLKIDFMVGGFERFTRENNLVRLPATQ